jgi:hypothetical protein
MLDLSVRTICDDVPDLRCLPVIEAIEAVAFKDIVEVDLHSNRGDVGSTRGENQTMAVVATRGRRELFRLRDLQTKRLSRERHGLR